MSHPNRQLLLLGCTSGSRKSTLAISIMIISSSTVHFDAFPQLTLLLTPLSSCFSGGYDNALVCCALEEADLDHMKIEIPGHRKTLLLLSKRTNPDEELHTLTSQQPFASQSHSAALDALHTGLVHPVLPNPKKNPIMSNQPRKLEGLNYWTRAKARTTPWVRSFPFMFVFSRLL